MVTDDNVIRIHERLDAIQEALNDIKIAQGIYGTLQSRFEQSVKDINYVLGTKVGIEEALKAQSKIEARLDHLDQNFDVGRRYINEYQGDRRFVLGIITAVTILLGAINGVAVKVVLGYFDDLESRIAASEKKATDLAKDAIFESQKVASDLSTLRDSIIQHQREKK